jgi:hypothetical protein
MFTRKLTSLTVAVTVGLIGLGAVFGGDGPPGPVPVPSAGFAPVVQPAPVAQPEPSPKTRSSLALKEAMGIALDQGSPAEPPAAPANKLDIDWRKDEAGVRALLLSARKQLASREGRGDAGKSSVLIDAICVRVPIGFCERSGLTADAPVPAWFLSQRERRMFTALLRAEPAMEILSRPQLLTPDRQTAAHQVDEALLAVTGLEAEAKDGKPVVKNGQPVYTPKVTKIAVGSKLAVTPKIEPSGQIQLQIKTEYSEPGGLVRLSGPTASEPGKPALFVPSINTEEHQTTVVVPDTGTVVIRSATSTHEILWMLTTYAVRTENNAVPQAPAAPKPLRFVPPAAPTRP